MEALLSLPVVMTVLVLLFNFSAAVIQKSRASVAVREVAFRHLIDASSVAYSKSEEVYNGTWPGVRDEAWRVGWRGYSFRETKVLTRGFKELTGDHPTGNKNDVELKGGDGDDDGGTGFLDLANGVLASLGGQRDFKVWLRADYPFEGAIAPGTREPMLPRSEVQAALVIDSSPWTKHELPCGYLSILTKALGLGDISAGPVSLASWLGCGTEAAPYDPGKRYADEAKKAQDQADADQAAAAERARKRAEEKAKREEAARQARRP